jgi:hypothetical protein
VEVGDVDALAFYGAQRGHPRFSGT